jgi:tetratricopeptide (TPR) repeat protein
MGLLLIPPAYRFIAGKLKWLLKPGTRILSVLVLLIIAVILIGSSSDADKPAKQQSPMNAGQQLPPKDSLSASTPHDTALIAKESIGISTTKVADLIHAGKYEAAHQKLDSLIPQNPDNADLLYSRALCYRKEKKMQEATADCKSAMQLGSKDAETLYNKINPPLKRVSYYITRCCDGTTSSATGRGACSHHGGVCALSQPVYEEYRKYD